MTSADWIVSEDSGAMLRDGIKSVVKQGVCKETDPGSAKGSAGACWPYDIRKFTTKPPNIRYTEAMNRQVVS